MEAVLKRALKRITPSETERQEFSIALERILKAADCVIKPLGLEKTIAGSFIRDTWLADKKEMHLFIMFAVSYSREELEKIGLDVGKKIIKKLSGKYKLAYAEHPYVKGEVNGFSVDIVPCYKVESASKIKSAVDRTPFHNKYILEHLKSETAGEVRLLKQFCKSMDVYGSDIRTLGFSGYLCELLIIKYKNFKGLTGSAKKWEFGVFIDLEGHCNLNPPLEHFKNQPLIVIDPTDPKRNVAASLSNENFIKFVDACGEFYEKPSLKFFEIKREPVKKREFRVRLKNRGTEVFLIEFERTDVVDDILWSQMRKTSTRIAKLLKENEFEIIGQDVWSDGKKSYLIFEVKMWNLPEIMKLTGPPIHSERHSEEFRGKYSGWNVYTENGRWVAEVKRKYRKVDGILTDFLKNPEKKLLNEGVRSHIAKNISKGFRILRYNETEKLIGRNAEFAIFLKKYFERKL